MNGTFSKFLGLGAISISLMASNISIGAVRLNVDTLKSNPKIWFTNSYFNKPITLRLCGTELPDINVVPNSNHETAFTGVIESNITVDMKSEIFIVHDLLVVVDPSSQPTMTKASESVGFGNPSHRLGRILVTQSCGDKYVNTIIKDT